MLDTNILSAIMGSWPVPEVAAWVSAQPEALLFTAAVCQAEVLASRSCRTAAAAASKWQHARFSPKTFDGRILPFEAKAATLYGELFAARRRAG